MTLRNAFITLLVTLVALTAAAQTPAPASSIDFAGSLRVYVSQAMGDDVISSIYPVGDDARFVYLEVTRRF